ncbi:uncharacterized protein SCHCODRAFT_02634355 [Schizophyllum commune H4-8]|uniref:Uncharacterized protein n=1 Tax=Schizophyllum commune (strain H4-8 / FGSC 9210) TaxID=578458 RepID=D8QC00_SCHCM|nr:uncharacterized protein SCHCODRAFT_02634355 [Schizophyllum commune H4-8]KAI5889383.1 hypothetical protein SCHCODRAFT_02634355 [Schizophyllum commune H4-8]
MQGTTYSVTSTWHGQDMQKYPAWSNAEYDHERRPLRAAQIHVDGSLLPSAIPPTPSYGAYDFSSNTASQSGSRHWTKDHGPMDVDAPNTDERHSSTSNTFLPTPPLTNRSPIGPTSLLPSLNPQVSAQAASSTTILPQTFFSFDTRISISIQGRPITLDLRALENDPQVIMELLRATDAERANWLIAAVYFRRAGNPAAAIAIANSLIEVMNAHSVQEQDRHPAYILLAGCESDLGKVARRVDPDNGDAKRHFESSRRWLQRVYGVNVPDDTTPLGTTMTTPLTTTSRPDKDTPRAPHSAQDQQGAEVSSPTSSRIAKYNKVLEREVDCLRDRQKRNEGIMDELRREKRRAEDELENERTVRRRLERQVSELEVERDSALRMEATALQQARQEVESRRRVQEALAEEQERRRELESRTGQVQGRPLLEDLARLFQQTSQERFPTTGNTTPYGGYATHGYGSPSTFR